MNKSELKPGMYVALRSYSHLFMVTSNEELLLYSIKTHETIPLIAYDEDLCYTINSRPNADIIAVYSGDPDTPGTTTLWTRPGTQHTSTPKQPKQPEQLKQSVRKGSIIWVNSLGNCFVIVTLNKQVAVCQHIDSPIWAEIPVAAVSEVLLY